MTATEQPDDATSLGHAYACMPVSRMETLQIRGLTYCIRRWGNPHGRPLLMLHGARDCSATFQFVAGAFQNNWNIIAPDWRGHGHSERTPQAYWVHDFLGDLDALLGVLFADTRPDVIGHSMGGNIAGLYAGLRPQRIRRFVSLDGIGPSLRRFPVDMTATLDAWLKQSPAQATGYATLAEVTRRLRKANHRLTGTQASFLAAHSVRQHADGQWRWLFDPAMTHSLPTLHTPEEWGAIWSRVTCPVRWIGSSDIRNDAPSYDLATIAQRQRMLPQAEYTRLENTGHNLHHDRPEDVAALIEEFLLREMT